MQPSNRKFLKNFVGFSMVSWISFLLGFVATPLSTRLFAPDELAKVNLFGTYTSLICSVCYLGLDQAFVRFYKERPPGVSQRGLLTFCLGVALGACALLAALTNASKYDSKILVEEFINGREVDPRYVEVPQA